jgi:tRNA-2-methylthio-N6-dimethylallyladenosine synthase
VLVDGVSRKSAGEAAGRTRCNRVVNFDTGGRDLLGRVVEVRITRALPHSLRGELADSPEDPGTMDRLPVGLAEPALPA